MSGQDKVESITWVKPRHESKHKGRTTALIDRRHMQFTGLEVSRLEAIVAQGGGPQPGGVVHPPNPRGWLLGEVQAIRQIYL